MLEVDHLVARARGGADDIGNLVTAWWDCNNGKRAKLVDSHAILTPIP
jgi:5-methylcytosine-specific restriction endonuclease McrA